ncbi:MAG: hypothetical protein HN472_09640 [Nitrospina sp.]|jgi:hypothetical protein|nr:hypothetical protein [Nitrospina sp.]MBT3509788.1 hypothetical protein [Nitrospina sp.]MBT3874887.1 hypothetical protein [Nitrospina sp.]MBT4049786.1 hypothetical protein [Nitrospina sp.]MBT4558732.1 hypothetical protein [Nitrospina sp.]
MKYAYYGFGAFIGFVCGMGINLIFYWLDQSGVKFAHYLINNLGFVGRYLLELINALPIIGAALGIILIKLLFSRELTERS